MERTILITGGTGLVGNVLVKKLLSKGYHVNLLVRKDDGSAVHQNLRQFKWDVYNSEIDPACIEDADAIIHLAGEEIAAKRWTDERKKQILESRTKSIGLIYELLRKNKHKVNHVIAASAVGYYGDRGSELLTESSLPSKDFLAETCIAWEESVDKGQKLGLRIVKLRSGIILDKDGGVLPQMDKSVRYGIAVIPGDGKQWVSWIHLKDAVNAYIYALENESLKGVYNMAAPEAVSLEKLSRCMAKAMKRSPLFIHAPEFALKLAIGEMSLMVLESTRVSGEKLEKTGFKFSYPQIKDAMAEIYSA